MAYTHTAYQVIGRTLDFIKVTATTTDLTTTQLSRDAVVNAICSSGVEPLIVGDGYNTGSVSALIVAVPASNTSLVAATLQTAIRATGAAGLGSATVSITRTLVG